MRPVVLLAGGVPPCAVFPPYGVSPRGVWGLCPLRSSDDAFSMILSPHPEPTSGYSRPDSDWQSAAARPGTTLSVPAPGRPPDHHHGFGTWPAAAEQCSKQNDQGLPKKRTGSEYEDDPYTEPEPPNLQEQMTEQREQIAALTAQLAALTAATMAGQRVPRARACERAADITQVDATWNAAARSATRDPPRGPTQGTHTEGTHTGDPHRGPAQGTHPHRGPTQRGGPHRGPTTGGEGHTDRGPTQNTHRRAIKATAPLRRVPARETSADALW